MMEPIKLPLLFSREKQEALNNAIFTKTDCFLFLKTQEILPGFAPKSYSDAFIEIVIGLYIIYHDLACLYWQVFLCEDFCPPGLEKWKLEKPKKHIECISKSLRPHLTHGFLLPRDAQSDVFRESLELLYDKGKNKLLPWGDSKTQWPKYMQMMTEDSWKQIVNTIIKDSDSFYELMFEWTDLWGKAISEGIPSPCHDFIWSYAFAKSIDSRVLAPYCEKLGIQKIEDHETLDKLRKHLRNFYEKSPNLKKPDRILKEMENWIKKQRQSGSSVTIAAKYGYALGSV